MGRSGSEQFSLCLEAGLLPGHLHGVPTFHRAAEEMLFLCARRCAIPDEGCVTAAPPAASGLLKEDAGQHQWDRALP